MNKLSNKKVDHQINNPFDGLAGVCAEIILRMFKVCRNIENLFVKFDLQIKPEDSIYPLVKAGVNIEDWYNKNKNSDKGVLLAASVELHAAKVLFKEGHENVRFIREAKGQKTPDIRSEYCGQIYFTEVKSSYLGSKLENNFIKDRIICAQEQIIKYPGRKKVDRGIIFIGHNRSSSETEAIQKFLENLRQSKDNILDNELIETVYVFGYADKSIDMI